MRTIGIDLAITTAHTAVAINEQGQFITPLIKFHARASELDNLLTRAREGDPAAELQVVMEPTGMAWFPIAAYLARQPGVTTYLINSQQVADLRRYYKRHAKSDRVDARVLARLPLHSPDQLHALVLPTAAGLTCQRGCKQLAQFKEHITATKHRLRAIDRFAWWGLDELVFPDPFSAAARWFREHWYNPVRIVQAGASTLRQQWQNSRLDAQDLGDWAEALVQLAQQIVALYGSDGPALDFEQLQAEVRREQAILNLCEELHHTLQIRTVRPLYRQLHPSRNLETLKGVGQDGAAVYVSFIGDPNRFESNRLFRGWSGMVPDSRASAGNETKGLHITQAGPDLIKRFSFVEAETARQWDPQIAALYYDQMVNKGKHHKQAICACATHLLDRVLTILREDRPYQLRDVDGTPVTAEQARTIIAERYTVPDEIRQRNNKRHRQERSKRRAEKQLQPDRHAEPDRAKH
jgi:transposase